MLIKKIELENINTHKKTEIEFQEGLNILLGQNGTGKSTIVKMIGYTLFDYLAGTQKSYIRSEVKNSPTHGTIKLWFVGLNDDIFVIERSIGKSNNTIEVRDGRTGVIIPGINDKQSLIDWLIHQFSLKSGYELSTIFETSIGIPQGTFCEPFYRTPTQRRDFFNPILQVDIYRKVWKKIKKVIELFSNDIDKVDIYIDNLSEYLIEKDNLFLENESLIEEMKEKRNELDLNQDKLINIGKELEKYNKLKENIDEIITETKQLLNQKETIIKYKEEIEKELEEAEKAQQLCERTEKDHLIHLKYLEKQDDLENLNEQLNQYKEQYQVLNEKVAKLNSLIKEKKREHKYIENSKESFTSLRKAYDDTETLQLEIEKMQKKMALVLNSEQKLNKLKSKYGEISKEFYSLKDHLNREEKLKKELLELENQELKQEQLKNEKIILETDLKQVLNFKDRSKGNNCPILNQKCLNVTDRSLESMFEEKIEESRKKITNVNQELAKVSEKIKEQESIRKEIEALTIAKTKFEEINNNRNEIIEEIKEHKTLTEKKEELQLKIEDLKKKRKTLEEKVKEYHILKNQIEKKLPTLMSEITNLETEKLPISKELVPLERNIKELQPVSAKLSELKGKITNTRKNHDIFQQYNKLAKKTPSLREQLKEQKNHFQKIESLIHQKLKVKSKNETEFKESIFNSLKKEKEQLIAKASQLKTEITHIETQIEKNIVTLRIMEGKQKDLDNFKNTKDWYLFLDNLTTDIRNWFNEAGPKITKALLNRINVLASQIYRDLMDEESMRLLWEEDFNIKVISPENQKNFSQLSGGEQMGAALSIRLAILKVLTNVDFAFFDEPTTNLDTDKRINLARSIQNIKGFKQLFVISHDDTFEEIADNVIKFTKDENEISQVEFLKK